MALLAPARQFDMPRFRVSTLLAVITLVGLWLSTLASYSAARDVRTLLMLAIAVGAAAEAIYSTGAWRAFWGGFAASYIVIGSRPLFPGFAPRMSWSTGFTREASDFFSRNPIRSPEFNEAILATIILLQWMVASLLIGLLCVLIYRRHHG